MLATVSPNLIMRQHVYSINPKICYSSIHGWRPDLEKTDRSISLSLHFQVCECHHPMTRLYLYEWLVRNKKVGGHQKLFLHLMGIRQKRNHFLFLSSPSALLHFQQSRASQRPYIQSLGDDLEKCTHIHSSWDLWKVSFYVSEKLLAK